MFNHLVCNWHFFVVMLMYLIFAHSYSKKKDIGYSWWVIGLFINICITFMFYGYLFVWIAFSQLVFSNWLSLFFIGGKRWWRDVMMMIRIARLSVYFIQLVSLTSQLRGNREGRLSAILMREAQINKFNIVYVTWCWFNIMINRWWKFIGFKQQYWNILLNEWHITPTPVNERL